MTLRDLLRKTSYHAIFNCIHKEYYYKDPDDEVIELSLAYRRVINKLLSYDMSPNPEYQILIRGVEGKKTRKLPHSLTYAFKLPKTKKLML